MTELTTACSALPEGSRQRDRHALQPTRERDFVTAIARMMSWTWARWRRREIIRTLDKMDDRLLRDAGIERSRIEEFADTLTARWR